MTHRQRSHHSTNPVIVVYEMLFVSVIRRMIKKQVPAVAIHARAFNADAEIARKEIFHVNAAAPGVGSPHAYVELGISVVLFARNRSNLLHLLAGILFCPSLTKCAQSAQNYYG